MISFRLHLIVLRLIPFLALAPAAFAQFSQTSLSSTPPTSAASPAILNVGQSYPNALTFTISFNQLGASISAIEMRGTIPPGLSTGGTQQGDAIVVVNRPNVVFFGIPTTPGDYALRVNAIASTGLNSLSQVAPWEVYFRVVGASTPPAITTQPGSQTVTAGATVTFTAAASGEPTPTFQWRKNGAAIAGATSATLTLSNVTTADAGDYSVVATNSAGSATSSNATLTVNPVNVAPVFTTQPTSVAILAGGTVVLNATATGTPAPTYQWRKNGVAIAGATSATLTLANVTAVEAGDYSVVATNAAGSVTSSIATVTVNPVNVSPAFSSHPISVTVVPGSTVALNARATGNPAPTYQWRKNTVSIAGATNASLVLPAVSAGDAGAYTVVATNAAGTATSNSANLSVAANADIGRLINLSILTSVTAADPLFTLGTVIGGVGTTGTKPLLIRAAGPSLTQLGVGDVLIDPKLEVFSGQTVIASNDDWAGTPVLATAMAQVGAFAYAAPNSKDSATFNPASAAGGYTVQVSGVGGATGLVIAELYDATSAGAFTATTPRLVNVSVLKQIPSGAILTAGFTIGGATAKTVLIRTIGPALGAPPFNIPGSLADPRLDLFSGQSIIASNDNWGGDTQLTTVGNSVGAFPISNSASLDAMLVITLPAGGYTVQASGVNATGGTAIVEVYDVP